MSEKPTGTPVEKYRPSDVYIFPTLIRNVMQFFSDSAILISFIILCSSINYHPSLFGLIVSPPGLVTLFICILKKLKVAFAL